MKIFLTGGTGFIGSRVVAQLTSRKHKVHVLKSRLGDIKKVEQELVRFKPDVVIHLAWEGIPNVGVEMSSKNLVQSLQFFELVKKHKIPKLIAAGSAWQYESEGELRISGHGPFVAAKNTLRIFGEESMKTHKGIFVWAIPFFVYGHGKKPASLMPSLLSIAKAGTPPVPKNPDAWHDFIYVDDVAHAFVLLATKKVPAGSYDLGSGVLTRTGTIAQIIARYYKLPSLSLRTVKKQGASAHVRPLTRATGWKPQVSITEGIARMAQEKI